MRLKLIQLVLLLALAGSAAAQSANEQKAEVKNEEAAGRCEYNQTVTKFFTVKHRSPSVLADTLKILLSNQSRITQNQALNILTVRDCQANLTAFEQMLARLDVPEQAPPSMEFQLHLLAASAKAVEGAAMPKQLEPVVAQLKSTLKYANYRYVYSALNRISNGGKIESSGVTGELFPAPPGVANHSGNPSFYSYSLHNVRFARDASGKDSVQIEIFKFGISVPILMNANGATQYKDIGLVTPLSLSESEIAVVGTANISGSDEALIVVVSVKKLK